MKHRRQLDPQVVATHYAIQLAKANHEWDQVEVLVAMHWDSRQRRSA